MRRIHLHGSELVHEENFFVLANSFLSEECGTFILKFNYEREN